MNSPIWSHGVSIEYTFGITYDPRGCCECGWTGPVRTFAWRAKRDANNHLKEVRRGG